MTVVVIGVVVEDHEVPSPVVVDQPVAIVVDPVCLTPAAALARIGDGRPGELGVTHRDAGVDDRHRRRGLDVPGGAPRLGRVDVRVHDGGQAGDIAAVVVKAPELGDPRVVREGGRLDDPVGLGVADLGLALQCRGRGGLLARLDLDDLGARDQQLPIGDRPDLGGGRVAGRGGNLPSIADDHLAGHDAPAALELGRLIHPRRASVARARRARREREKRDEQSHGDGPTRPPGLPRPHSPVPSTRVAFAASSARAAAARWATSSRSASAAASSSTATAAAGSASQSDLESSSRALIAFRGRPACSQRPVASRSSRPATGVSPAAAPRASAAAATETGWAARLEQLLRQLGSRFARLLGPAVEREDAPRVRRSPRRTGRSARPARRPPRPRPARRMHPRSRRGRACRRRSRAGRRTRPPSGRPRRRCRASARRRSSARSQSPRRQAEIPWSSSGRQSCPESPSRSASWRRGGGVLVDLRPARGMDGELAQRGVQLDLRRARRRARRRAPAPPRKQPSPPA